MKKLAIIRSPDGPHQCPFGLSVKISCKNAGDSVLRMEVLDNVDADDRDLQKEHNIAVYALHGNGRCVFADKIAENADVVHCDYGEPGAGIRDTAMDPIQIYPRMFGAMGIHGYYSYPLASYWDNPGNANLFDGIYGYANSETEDLIIKANSTEEAYSNGQPSIDTILDELIRNGETE